MRKTLISLAVISGLAGCVSSGAPQGDPQDDNYRYGIAADYYRPGGGVCASCRGDQEGNADLAKAVANAGRSNYGGAIGAGGGLRGGGGGGFGGGGGGRR